MDYNFKRIVHVDDLIPECVYWVLNQVSYAWTVKFEHVDKPFLDKQWSDIVKEFRVLGPLL